MRASRLPRWPVKFSTGSPAAPARQERAQKGRRSRAVAEPQMAMRYPSLQTDSSPAAARSPIAPEGDGCLAGDEAAVPSAAESRNMYRSGLKSKGVPCEQPKLS